MKYILIPVEELVQHKYCNNCGFCKNIGSTEVGHCILVDIVIDHQNCFEVKEIDTHVFSKDMMYKLP